MKPAQSIIGSAVFLVFAPGIVAVAVPWWLSRWRINEPLLGFAGFRVIGGLFIAAGLPLLPDSFRRFALEGLGTPAPVASTKHPTGLYRYVRNPMYIAVSLMILGQGLLLGNRDLLIYGVLVCLGFSAFVWLYEEPALRRTFGPNMRSSAPMCRGRFLSFGRGGALAIQRKSVADALVPYRTSGFSFETVGGYETSAAREFTGADTLAALKLNEFYA